MVRKVRRTAAKRSEGGGRAGKLTYTDLIAKAILSSPQKRLKLAEIYDWFVANVPSLKDKRFLHSSLGWKNAVRHHLSIRACFKRVTLNDTVKPSWWTIDVNEQSGVESIRRLRMDYLRQKNLDEAAARSMNAEYMCGQSPTNPTFDCDRSVPIRRQIRSQIRSQDVDDGCCDDDNTGKRVLLSNVTSAMTNAKTLAPLSMKPSVTLICQQDTCTRILHSPRLEVSISTGEMEARRASYGSQAMRNISGDHSSRRWSVGASSSINNNGSSNHNNNGCVSQTLRVQNRSGVVQGVQFTGALPVRVVQRVDMGTQTEYAQPTPTPTEEVQDIDTFIDSYFAEDRLQTAVSVLPGDLSNLQLEGDLHCDLDRMLVNSIDQMDANDNKNLWLYNNNTLGEQPARDLVATYAWLTSDLCTF